MSVTSALLIGFLCWVFGYDVGCAEGREALRSELEDYQDDD